MLKGKEGERYAQHRAQTLGIIGLGSRLATLAGALLILAISSIMAEPQVSQPVAPGGVQVVR